MPRFPLPSWVVRGARVECIFEHEVPFDIPSSLIIKKGDPGIVLDVDESNIRVYLGAATDLFPGTPEWKGFGEPVEPYRYVDYLRGEFADTWARDVLRMAN